MFAPWCFESILKQNAKITGFISFNVRICCFVSLLIDYLWVWPVGRTQRAVWRCHLGFWEDVMGIFHRFQTFLHTSKLRFRVHSFKNPGKSTWPDMTIMVQHTKSSAVVHRLPEEREIMVPTNDLLDLQCWNNHRAAALLQEILIKKRPKSKCLYLMKHRTIKWMEIWIIKVHKNCASSRCPENSY